MLASAVNDVGCGARYFLGTPITGVSGGFHRVCWGYAPVNMFDYKVQIDGTPNTPRQPEI